MSCETLIIAVVSFSSIVILACVGSFVFAVNALLFFLIKPYPPIPIKHNAKIISIIANILTILSEPDEDPPEFLFELYSNIWFII